jgi:membrane-associated phospholipid phosphatase
MTRGIALATAVAALAALWLAMMVSGTGTLDRAVLALLYAADRPGLSEFLRNFTLLGNWPAVVGVSLLAAVWLLATGHRRSALVLLAITLVGRALVEAMKIGVHRSRPESTDHLVPVYSLSFPSAHAANSMILWLSIALLLPKREWRPAAVVAALVISFAVGISRPMLGVHWPSDVIGGWSFGAAWVLAMIHITGRWPAPKPPPGESQAAR